MTAMQQPTPNHQSETLGSGRAGQQRLQLASKKQKQSQPAPYEERANSNSIEADC
jgi:hypothetical protein